MNIKMRGGNSVTINGKTFSGSSISIRGNKVVVDGVTQEGELVGDSKGTVVSTLGILNPSKRTTEQDEMKRYYNVIWVRDDNGTRGQFNAEPMTHAEACTLKSKITDYPWRRVLLEDV